jgi:hypothetical protein
MTDYPTKVLEKLNVLVKSPFVQYFVPCAGCPTYVFGVEETKSFKNFPLLATLLEPVAAHELVPFENL